MFGKIFAMLKITSEKDQNSRPLRLEGSLTGPWVWRTRARVANHSTGRSPLPVVDLTNVTFVGEDGKLLLKRMWREGVALIAAGCCTGHLVEEITRSRPNESSI